ncbi:MAG: alpha/beta hydrolase family protein [Phycisphaerales bacterium]
MARLGPRAEIPALVAHPDVGWETGRSAVAARPVMVWFHGRTVSKELDPGRYLRWLRAAMPDGSVGFGVCAVDLPGHGERFDEALQAPTRTLEVVERAAAEVDAIVADLGSSRWNGAFDVTRMGIGGMSAGGMVTLVRLCSSHSFRCAAVEATSGAFGFMVERGLYDASAAARLEPLRRLIGWRPVPLLALHSEADEWVPVSSMRSFLTALAGRYREAGADASMIEFKTWESTGAPNEHYGFGRVANEAKNVQVGFLGKALGTGH